MTIREQIATYIKLAKEHLRVHAEGKKIILNLLMWLLIINGLLFFLSINDFLLSIIYLLSLGLFVFVIYYFRNPVREVISNEKYIYAPVDGKLIGVEEVVETECLNKPCMRVSVKVSLIDVHLTRIPVSADIKYYRFHQEDNHLSWHQILWHNESTSFAFTSEAGHELFIKQSGGAVVSFVREGMHLDQGEDLGFIKFGSLVDIYLPINTELCVNVGERLVGNKTILAKLK